MPAKSSLKIVTTPTGSGAASGSGAAVVSTGERRSSWFDALTNQVGKVTSTKKQFPETIAELEAPLATLNPRPLSVKQFFANFIKEFNATNAYIQGKNNSEEHQKLKKFFAEKEKLLAKIKKFEDFFQKDEAGKSFFDLDATVVGIESNPLTQFIALGTAVKKIADDVPPQLPLQFDEKLAPATDAKQVPAATAAANNEKKRDSFEFSDNTFEYYVKYYLDKPALFSKHANYKIFKKELLVRYVAKAKNAEEKFQRLHEVLVIYLHKHHAEYPGVSKDKFDDYSRFVKLSKVEEKQKDEEKLKADKAESNKKKHAAKNKTAALSSPTAATPSAATLPLKVDIKKSGNKELEAAIKKDPNLFMRGIGLDLLWLYKKQGSNHFFSGALEVLTEIVKDEKLVERLTEFEGFTRDYQKYFDLQSKRSKANGASVELDAMATAMQKVNKDKAAVLESKADAKFKEAQSFGPAIQKYQDQFDKIPAEQRYTFERAYRYRNMFNTRIAVYSDDAVYGRRDFAEQARNFVTWLTFVLAQPFSKYENQLPFAQVETEKFDEDIIQLEEAIEYFLDANKRSDLLVNAQRLDKLLKRCEDFRDQIDAFQNAAPIGEAPMVSDCVKRFHSVDTLQSKISQIFTHEQLALLKANKDKFPFLYEKIGKQIEAAIASPQASPTAAASATHRKVSSVTLDASAAGAKGLEAALILLGTPLMSNDGKSNGVAPTLVNQRRFSVVENSPSSRARVENNAGTCVQQTTTPTVSAVNASRMRSASMYTPVAFSPALAVNTTAVAHNGLPTLGLDGIDPKPTPLPCVEFDPEADNTPESPLPEPPRRLSA